MTILLVEDHLEMAEMLRGSLEHLGHTVEVATDGIEGERRARKCDYDVLVVDWTLPGQDGPSLIRQLRRAGETTPILMLTGRDKTEDEIHALNVGADDFLTKPFASEVLYSRLHALHRRNRRASRDHTLTTGPLSLNLQKRTAELNGEPLDLRAKEFDLLMTLTDHPNSVLTRKVIAERVWDSVYVTDDVLNTTVSSLRRKMARAQRDGLDDDTAAIETVRGVGYRLNVPQERLA